MLTARIAQRIADEVMSELGYNINVMDDRGIIIGSGSLSRIGAFHETARRVLECKETIMVTEKQAVDLVGVLPGINMPIRSNGALVGVVGITGNPDEVKGVARLVRMAAELILEQEESIYRHYMHRSDKNAFVLLLLNESSSGSSKGISTWAAELGYDMKLPRVACLFDFPKPSTASNAESQERCLRMVNVAPLHTRQDISVFMGQSVLVFKTLKDTSPWGIEREVGDYLDSIRNGSDAARDVRCRVGCYHPHIEGYSQSYLEAGRLQQQRPDDPDSPVFSHRSVCAECFEALSSDYREQVLSPYVAAFRREFGDGTEDAVRTAKMLLGNGFRYEDAANRLFVHKNTIAFRRKKIEKCLGLDPRNSVDDSILLMLILLEFEAQLEQ